MNTTDALALAGTAATVTVNVVAHAFTTDRVNETLTGEIDAFQVDDDTVILTLACADGSGLGFTNREVVSVEPVTVGA